MGMPLSVRDLGCVIGGRKLWHGIHLTVGPGDRWAIAGPSGAGKTLLLRTLAGLVARDSGEISLAGKPLERWWPPAWRAQVVYVPQGPTLPEGTVEAALAASFRLRVHRDKQFPRDTVRRYLDAVCLGADFLGQDAGRLSGGEAQVVNVLRALLIEPSILLLDEPTASLDSGRAARIEALIDDWMAGDHERACVWTSHDQAQLERVSDRSLVLGSTTV